MAVHEQGKKPDGGLRMGLTAVVLCNRGEMHAQGLTTPSSAPGARAM